jgi:release factor glutamine methyltransferase
MKNSKILFQELKESLTIHESSEEKESIIYLVLENLTRLSRNRIIAGDDIEVGAEEHETLKQFISRINRYEPVQYILGEAPFYGRTFKVSPAVLIPRPETELLIDLVKTFVTRKKNSSVQCLDVGTGSGCIAITLALEIPASQLFATDVSPEALQVAMENNAMLASSVNFMCHDILKAPLPFEKFDVIVSNPPYVREKEKQHMSRNVLDYEPALALFVPDDDPLIYYHSIFQQAKNALLPSGFVAVEINENFGSEIKKIAEKNDFTDIVVQKDFSSKDRVVTAMKRSR